MTSGMLKNTLVYIPKSEVYPYSDDLLLRLIDSYGHLV